MKDGALIYNTTDLRFSALILSEIPGSTFVIIDQSNSFQKIIQISHSESQQEFFSTLLNSYVNRKVKVDLYSYNRALNALRDKLKRGGT
jgi:hypothetical protein